MTTTAPGERIRVLHVDDDAGFADMAASMLERTDDRLTVYSVFDPDEGLRTLAEREVDCIVSDYDMPGTNGVELLEAVRETHPDIPFVLFTGKGSEEIAGEAISAGVTDYLQKGTGTSQYAVLANRITNAVAQHRAERSAEATRRRYRSLIEESTDVITVVNAEGVFEYVSPAAERILGHESESLVGENGFEYVHPDDRRQALEEFGKSAADPQYQATVEFRFERGDGEWVWLQNRSRNLLDDPDIEGIVVYSRDVTAEKDRRQRLERHASLFRDTSDPIAMVEFRDGTPVIREANDAFRSTFAPDTELVGRDIDGIVASGNRLGDAKEITERAVAGDIVRREITRDTVDGPREFSCQILPVESGVTGGVDSAFAVYTDITDLKEREAELEATRKKAEALAETIPDAAFIKSVDGTYLDAFVGDEAEELLYGGRDAYESGQHVRDVFDDDVDRVLETIRRAVETGAIQTIEYELEVPSGPRWFEGRVAPIPGTIEGEKAVVWVARDVTERREREQGSEE